MTDDGKWQEPFEDDGITLGPEEALRREIERSKSLKLERLQLKDRIEKLERENASLRRNLQAQKNPAAPEDSELPAPPLSRTPVTPPFHQQPLVTAALALTAILFFILWMRG